MTPRQAEGRGAQSPAIAIPLTTSTDQDADHHHRSGEHRHGRDLPMVAAVAVPPIGRRTMWMLWVASCCLCGLAHRHQAGAPVGGVRDATCGGGAYYVRVVRQQVRKVAA